MQHKGSINIPIDNQAVEKISLGTHLPHPLWVITPGRISGLTPDLAKERHWKENSSPLYPHLCLLQESELGEDFSRLPYSVQYLTCRVCTRHWNSGRLCSLSHPMKSRWREAGGFSSFIFFTAQSIWLAFKAGGHKCHTTLSLLGALINKSSTTAHTKAQTLGILLLSGVRVSPCLRASKRSN